MREKYQLLSRILLLTCCRSQNRFENFYVKYSTQIKFAAPMKKFEVIEDLVFYRLIYGSNIPFDIFSIWSYLNWKKESI